MRKPGWRSCTWWTRIAALGPSRHLHTITVSSSLSHPIVMIGCRRYGGGYNGEVNETGICNFTFRILMRTANKLYQSYHAAYIEYECVHSCEDLLEAPHRLARDFLNVKSVFGDSAVLYSTDVRMSEECGANDMVIQNTRLAAIWAT